MEKFREAGCPENEIRGALVAHSMKDELDLGPDPAADKPAAEVRPCMYGVAWGNLGFTGGARCSSAYWVRVHGTEPVAGKQGYKPSTCGWRMQKGHCCKLWLLSHWASAAPGCMGLHMCISASVESCQGLDKAAGHGNNHSLCNMHVLAPLVWHSPEPADRDKHKCVAQLHASTILLIA